MDISDDTRRPPPEPAGDPAKAAGYELPAVVKVWRCTIREDFEDEPAFRVFVPPGTEAKEFEDFLVEHEYVEPAIIVPPYWLDEQPDDPEAAEPGEDDLILERDGEGNLRVKRD